MKKYIISLMLLLGAVPAMVTCKPIADAVTSRVTCDVIIENAQTLIKELDDNYGDYGSSYWLFSGDLEDTVFEALKRHYGYVKKCTLSRNVVKKLDDTRMHYTFDAIIATSLADYQKMKLDKTIPSSVLQSCYQTTPMRATYDSTIKIDNLGCEVAASYVENVRLKFDVTIENPARLIDVPYSKFQSLDLFKLYIDELQSDDRIKILTDDVQCLPNGDLRYSFDAVIKIKRYHSQVIAYLLDKVIKNDINNKILCSALRQEFDATSRNRSVWAQQWGTQIVRSLLSDLDMEEAANWDSDYRNLLAIKHDLINPEKPDVKAGAYLYNEFGATVKINEFLCEAGDFTTLKKTEPQTGATHLFDDSQEQTTSADWGLGDDCDYAYDEY